MEWDSIMGLKNHLFLSLGELFFFKANWADSVLIKAWLVRRNGSFQRYIFQKRKIRDYFSRNAYLAIVYTIGVREQSSFYL
jgi:hypothetical protein